jgi:hypothetical protein
LVVVKGPSYPKEQELISDNVFALSLPPSVTNFLQLMEQGVSECLKRKCGGQM